MTDATETAIIESCRRGIISGGDSRKVLLWNPETGKLVLNYKIPEEDITAIKQLKGERTTREILAVACFNGGEIKLLRFDAEGEMFVPVSRLLGGHMPKKCIFGIDYSDEQNFLVSGGNDGFVCTWKLDFLDESLPLERVNPAQKYDQNCDDRASCIFTVRVLPGHSSSFFFASGSRDKTIKLWDGTKGLCVHTFREHTKSILGLAYESRKTTLYSCSNDETIRYFDLRSKKCVRTLKKHVGGLRSLLVTPELNELISGGQTNPTSDLYVYDLRKDSTPRTHVKSAHKRLISGIVNMTNTEAGSDHRFRYFCTASQDYKIKVWDRAKDNSVKFEMSDTREVYGLDYYDDGTDTKTLAAAQDISERTNDLVKLFGVSNERKKEEKRDKIVKVTRVVVNCGSMWMFSSLVWAERIDLCEFWENEAMRFSRLWKFETEKREGLQIKVELLRNEIELLQQSTCET